MSKDKIDLGLILGPAPTRTVAVPAGVAPRHRRLVVTLPEALIRRMEASGMQKSELVRVAVEKTLASLEGWKRLPDVPASKK